MKSRSWIFIILALVLWLGLRQFRDASEKRLEPQSTTAQDKRIRKVHVLPEVKEKKQETLSQNAAQEEVDEVQLHRATTAEVIPPSKELIREEVRQNAHRSPPSYAEMARDLSQKIRRARGDIEFRGQFFESLSDCILQNKEESTRAVRAFCLVNARRLAEEFEELQGSLDGVEAQASSDVLQLADQLR